ncbi:unnamed protein product [Haemonchus placei]|uniref:Phlebovirus_G2 domain-containing protein n=1 Tax=Haemonchus placei TaxID=6290 RepID=A0A0N4W776_HAEPC|nr:unnamed protein product [Haemonchus placei]
MSKINTVPLDILGYKPTHVCSFQESPNCAEDRKLGILHQIELYDGAKIVVRELHTTTREFLDENDYYCFDAEGKTVPLPLPSAIFLSTTHILEPNPRSVFCLYSSAVTTFDTDTTSFIIKAWGTTTKEYYPYRQDKGISLNVYSIPKCVPGGVSMETTETYDRLEVCVASICIYAKKYKADTAIFSPSSFAMFHLNGWIKGKRSFATTLFCPGQPICETIHCRMCWQKLYNVQCWSITEIAASLIFAMAIMVMLHLCTPIFRIIRWAFKKGTCFFVNIFKSMLLKFKTPTKRKQTYNVSTASYQPRRRKKKLYGVIATAMLLTPASQCCSDIVSIRSDTVHCTVVNDKNQEACFLLTNRGKEPMGTIAIRLENIADICQQKTEYFTRDHQFYSESRHQCLKTESCHGNICRKITPNTKLNDFSIVSNANPGYTFCVPSCKCLWCNFFFYCEDTCLFYLTFSTIYRIHGHCRL